MRGKIHTEKIEPAIEIQRTASIILSRQEYDELKNVFCQGKGWSSDYPDTVNIHSVTLTGNYKWMPASEVKLQIEIEGQRKIQE